MADSNASGLTELAQVDVATTTDWLVIDDVTAGVTKKITPENLVSAVTAGALTGHLHGLTLSNNGSDATNDIDISAGSCRDSTDAQTFSPTAMTKQLDAGWAAGSAAGMRNSGAAIANTTYHIYAVCKAAGASPDFYAHTSTTVATVITALQAESGGTDYIYARRIGSIVRASAAILAFRQTGDRFDYVNPVVDVSAAANTSVTARTLSVPVGIKVEAILTVFAVADAASNNWVSDPDNGSVTGGPGASVVYTATATAGDSTSAYIRVMTNTSAQVNSDSNGTNATITILTNGWIDTRGRLY